MDYKLISPQNPGESKIERILRNRGIEDIEHYLNTSPSDVLSPAQIFNMDNGIKMLI